MTEQIDYTKKMETAMRTLIPDLLSEVEESGLPGNHHFFITYDPRYPGSEISDWLLEKYPEEMTIIIQHWFEELKVSNEYFEITLNFGDSPERLKIIFESIISFVDPSVEFGLKFEKNKNTNSDIDEEIPHEEQSGEESNPKIINLDSFRK
jgi:hypothetical protein